MGTFKIKRKGTRMILIDREKDIIVRALLSNIVALEVWLEEKLESMPWEQKPIQGLRKDIQDHKRLIAKLQEKGLEEDYEDYIERDVLEEDSLACVLGYDGFLY